MAEMLPKEWACYTLKLQDKEPSGCPTVHACCMQETSVRVIRGFCSQKRGQEGSFCAVSVGPQWCGSNRKFWWGSVLRNVLQGQVSRQSHQLVLLAPHVCAVASWPRPVRFARVCQTLKGLHGGFCCSVLIRFLKASGFGIISDLA